MDFTTFRKANWESFIFIEGSKSGADELFYCHRMHLCPAEKLFFFNLTILAEHHWTVSTILCRNLFAPKIRRLSFTGFAFLTCESQNKLIVIIIDCNKCSLHSLWPE